MTSTQGAFDAFWDSMDRDPASVPLDIVLEQDDFYSQPEWDVYRMRYSSLDGYRLFAWLSIPNRDSGANAPAVIRMPDYASVHDLIYTPLRHHAIVMNATYRGQRNSDEPFQAKYPGLLTEGIDRIETYVMRWVWGDALRGVDALLSQQVAEVGPLALMGTGLGASLALAAAARRPVVQAVAADTPLALGNAASVEGGLAYPLAELDDYLRLNPEHRDAVLASTSPFDLTKIAPRVAAPVLLNLGKRDRGQCPVAVGEALAALLPQCDLRGYDGASEGGGHEHALVRESWLAQQLAIG